MTKSPRRLSPWPDGLVTVTDLAASREYDRILGLLHSGDLKADPTHIVFSTDGLLQFARADLIPFFHCSGERVEELLQYWTGDAEDRC